MKLFNRELSWLSFNQRVLQESLDVSNPLVERLRFLGIYSNNMDEFYRVRVASLRRLILIGKRKIDGFQGGPNALLKEIKRVVLDQQRMFELSYQKLLRELKDNQILQINGQNLRESEITFIQTYFNEKIRPEIVPIMLSSKRGFPQLKDGGNYLGIKMTDFERSRVKYALIEIPVNGERFIIIPTDSTVKKIMLLDDLIRFNLAGIFSIFNFDTITANSFKITRDAELDVDDDISKSYLEKMKDSVEGRKAGETVRFVYDSAMPIDQLQYLMSALKLKPGENIIPGGTYHNFKDFMSFPDFGNKKFTFPSKKPIAHPYLNDGKEPLIKKILNKDVLITYPFQKFQHVIDVLREAAIDPKVISIKINLYRVAPKSQIINALISAAQNGIKVSAIIELKARFDEYNNINWSNYLEDNGVNVLFGVPNLKVHSKLFLIKRKTSGNKTQQIAHIGTGNFHEKTARIYTDCSLLTADRSITREVEKVFRIFKNNIDRSVFRELLVSPFNVRRKLYALIDHEINAAKNGEEASIEIKLNNLVDSKVIKHLYKASQHGVKIRCVIRGICALVPGIPGLSENIEVRSIVGQYLEHTRIFVFHNSGNPRYFISSADWMTRNLDRRIEVAVPIYDPELQEDLKFMLDACFKDNQKARVIDALQKNKNVKSELTEKYNAQNEIYNYFKSKKWPLF